MPVLLQLVFQVFRGGKYVLTKSNTKHILQIASEIIKQFTTLNRTLDKNR